jgi:hypothetical protein
MATEDSTPPFPMGQAELTNLAQRIRARAESVFFCDQPVQQLDMLACAAAIDELIRLRREFRRLADEHEGEDLENAIRSILGCAQ